MKLAYIMLHDKKFIENVIILYDLYGIFFEIINTGTKRVLFVSIHTFK